MIDIDDEALCRASELLGTTTAEDTVNTALRQVAARSDRARALNRIREPVDEGSVDLNLLMDKRNYRR
ncbi:type II toxin-antitoxin system VapB family antitoxin [Nocardiopsis sp. LOL_012]|uniref:type II toxin-antitoxin system VapB family antitoxin n=1 Tax=Nocardiopsis sp. LOL_012 TaxID=3345409 RepID=UPI003A870395